MIRRPFSWVCILLLAILLGGCAGPQKTKDPADIHYMLGVSYLGEGNATLALKELLKATEINPDRPDIQQALAQAYHVKKAFGEAETHYLKALQLAPDDPQIENNLAALYLDMQRWDDALRYFRKAARNLLFANPEIALTGAGFADYQKGNYVDAIRFYQEAISTNPRYAQAHLRLGQAYYAMDKTELAKQEYLKALELAPDYAAAHYELGLVYMKLRDIPAAEVEFKSVQQLVPDSDLAGKAENFLKILE